MPRRKAAFTPKLSPQEAEVLCCRYDYEKDFWFEVAGCHIRNRKFSREHFDTIFEWKTGNRGKSRTLKNKKDAIELALKHVAENPDDPKASLCELTKLSGVGIPVASAIMTAVFPERFTVIDFRALEALNVPGYSTSSIPKYLEYVEYCNRLAKDWSLSLRDLDRALWIWSEKRGGKLLSSLTESSTGQSLRA